MDGMTSAKRVVSLPGGEWLLEKGGEHLPEELLKTAASARPDETSNTRWVRRASKLTPRERWWTSQHDSLRFSLVCAAFVLGIAALFVPLVGAPAFVPGLALLGGVLSAASSVFIGVRYKRFSADPEKRLGPERSFQFSKFVPRHQILVHALWGAYKKGYASHPELGSQLDDDLWEGVALVRDRDRLVRAAPSPDLLDEHPVIAELDQRISSLIQGMLQPTASSRVASVEDVEVFERIAEEVSANLGARREMKGRLRE